MLNSLERISRESDMTWQERENETKKEHSLFVMQGIQVSELKVKCPSNDADVHWWHVWKHLLVAYCCIVVGPSWCEVPANGPKSVENLYARKTCQRWCESLCDSVNLFICSQVRVICFLVRLSCWIRDWFERSTPTIQCPVSFFKAARSESNCGDNDNGNANADRNYPKLKKNPLSD